MTRKFISLLFLAMLTVTSSYAVNSFFTPLDLDFNGVKFELKYSTNPLQGYFKQEYVPSGQSVEHYNDMLIIDVLEAKTSPKDAKQVKITELEQMKANGFYVRYDERKVGNNFVLDFVIMAKINNESVLEHNIYHYTTQYGRLVLFALSHREYGEVSMRAYLDKDINEFSEKGIKATMPVVKFKSTYP
ncbi:hypothetical protein KDD93_07810 [Campylobacter sp. faydin G-24]|uniref:DUF1795 domain-containing protein n=1 Tax=Campylobacter anatolicus TaxID=2829105 RepID=A0ABS5HLD2_9BACT|nr:hypothetical protein [Campylobacter anatolicus]MBR8464467.1 hypothetical protein [Campylobacter anatolicus]MBR8466320.1 hypothetical protein [Campylobacter anatolicus]